MNVNGSTADKTGRAPFVTWAIVGAAVLAFPFAGGLELTRTGIAAGELWRLFTGHLTHFSLYHLLVDGGTLLALGWLYERKYGSLRWGLLLAFAAAGIGAAFLALERPLDSYRGLSGLDCAAFAAAVLAELDRRRVLAVLMGLLFAAKIVYEQAAGAFLFPQASWGDMGLPVLTSHTVGAVAGFLAGLSARASRGLRPWALGLSRMLPHPPSPSLGEAAQGEETHLLRPKA